MADKKISELTAASLLTGIEVLPIVQDGETRKLDINTLQSQVSIPAVSSTLHRSPNAITALFVYDTSKDSDPTWVDRCQHTSWYNETIYGKWLGAQASEAAARAVSGATTGDYYQLTTDGKFYKLNATSGVTEVFRGNKRSFPKLAAIVAESASVTIYDLTEAGRPMFCRFIATANATITSKYLLSGANALAAINGKIYVGGTGTNLTGLTTIDFATDKSTLRLTSGYTWNGNLSTRNTVRGYTTVDASVGAIVNATANAVATTVLPDAPVDSATGLKVPTIAVATNGGLSLIQNTGTVRNSSSTLAFTQVTLTPQLLSAGRADAVWYYAANPGSLGASFALTTKNASTATDFNAGNTTLLKAKDRKDYARTSGALVQLLRNNEGTIGKGVAAKLSDTYNTGWLAGDIRRAYLANSKTADRSYKGATATETGTVTSAAVNTGNDLVAYSGFSAADYIQEPFSADLDFGTGEWSCSAWVNTTQPAVGGNLLRQSEAFSASPWVINQVLGTGVTPTLTADAGTDPLGGSTADRLQVSRAATSTSDRSMINQPSIAVAPGTNYCFSFWAKSNTGSNQELTLACNWGTTGSVVNLTVTTEWQRFSSFANTVAATTATVNIGLGLAASTATSADVLIWGAQMEPGTEPTTYVPTTTVALPGVGMLAHRAFSSGPTIQLNMTVAGLLSATAYDGTTTRTVTTLAAYNTATWIKADAQYTTDGKLAILVNGVQVRSTTGTPLLTLNNADAVLTIGNSYALDAPFPGSIALLKLSASVPTAEQATWMYEQEKHLFSTGAKCVLPASTSVLDLAYDDATDTWSTLQATYESSFSGLVRTATQTPSAGSFSKVAEGSGVKLLGRTTTNPGVDVQMPAKNLRSKDMPKDTNQDITVFDFDAVTSQTDFVLPVGYTARVVYSAGAQKRIGSTKDYTVLFDGFRETVRFGTAPGNGVWVQIHAVKEVSL